MAPSATPADIRAAVARASRRAIEVLTNVRVISGEEVLTSDGEVPYDFLVLAAGARHSYFGKDEWEKLAPGLKSLDDALEIRRRMLMAFEVAEKTTDDAERRAALTFVIVGGGPTGVEMAGAIAEIARTTLRKDFRHIDPSQARVVLLDAAPRVLQAFVPELSESAKRQLEAIGVEVHVGTMVEKLEADGVTPKGGEKIFARTIIWAAGNAASPLGASLAVPLDRQGRVIVDEDLQRAGTSGVFAIGDMALSARGSGDPLPGALARHAGGPLRMREEYPDQIAGGWTEPFRYFDKGTMATIGTHRAVADAGFMRLRGFLAWRRGCSSRAVPRELPQQAVRGSELGLFYFTFERGAAHHGREVDGKR